MTILPLLAALLCSPATPAVTPLKAAPPARPDAINGIAPADQQWTRDADGIGSVSLWGDGNTSAFGQLIKFPAGARNAQHTHTSTLKSVVVSGTYLAGADASSLKEYGPGSYVMIPAGVPHASGCKAGQECEVLQFYDGKYDETPAAAARR